MLGEGLWSHQRVLRLAPQGGEQVPGLTPPPGAQGPCPMSWGIAVQAKEELGQGWGKGGGRTDRCTLSAQFHQLGRGRMLPHPFRHPDPCPDLLSFLSTAPITPGVSQNSQCWACPVFRAQQFPRVWRGISRPHLAPDRLDGNPCKWGSAWDDFRNAPGGLRHRGA